MLHSSTLPEAELSIRFRPRWPDIEPVCRSAADWFTAALGHSAASGTIYMVSSELLENTVRHSVEGPPVTMECALESDGVVIRMCNHANPANAQQLENILAWVDTFDEPRDAYVAKLQEIAAAPKNTRGGLGLVRVVYEGGATLRVEVDRKNSMVSVEARLGFDSRKD